MTISYWLDHSIQKLQQSDIPSARLDCLILLEDCLNTDRAQLLASPNRKLTPEHIKWLNNRIRRRAKHEPLAYIRRRVEFYGRQLYIDKRVLVPRPETEPMVSLVKGLRHQKTIRLADIGSGSGCIGITIALELPDAQVDLYDIDPATFVIARQNAKAYQASVHFYKGNLLQDLVTSYDVVLANLPYVPDGAAENIDVYFEPSHALFAGSDGLDLYRDFWQQVAKLSEKPRYILTEARPKYQQPTLTLLAKDVGYRLTHTDGFVQMFELV